MRMISSAIVVLAGAILIGTAKATDATATVPEALGWLLTLAGGAAFLIDYARSWKRPDQN